MNHQPRSDPGGLNLRQRIAGLTNVAKHGPKQVVAPARTALEAKYRAQAVAVGCRTEEEIQNQIARLRRLQALKARQARADKAAARP